MSLKTKRSFFNNITSIAILLVLAFFSILMLDITIPYLSFSSDVAFLKVKQTELQNPVWKVAFYVHVLSSMFALIAGFTQFSTRLLSKYKQLHRYMGWMYVVVVLCLSGPSGLVMAFYARGGLVSSIAFVVLSILWLVFTAMALRHVLSKNFEQHKNFMIRSYALTLSAVTLRAWKWIIVLLFHPRPIDVYIVVAWLGFIPNLIIAELIIRRLRKK